MNKHIALTLILFVVGIVFTLGQCVTLGDLENAEHIPTSWGKYKIDSVANEVLLKKRFPDAGHSECGLADDDFVKYARSKIDYRRQFQFIVFTEGKTMTGKRCLRTALIFYLKKKK